MSDLYRKVSLDPEAIRSGSEDAFLLWAVPVEPVGTITVEGADYGSNFAEIEGDHGNHGFPTILPPGEYLIVEAPKQ